MPTVRTVYEVGDIFLTITKEGKATEWIVGEDGVPRELRPEFGR